MNARTAVDLFAGRIAPGVYPNTEAGCDDAVQALDALVERVVQLERVAEVARKAADLAPMARAPDLVNALWFVHQALAELDRQGPS